jgi:hypothetical protein
MSRHETQSAKGGDLRKVVLAQTPPLKRIRTVLEMKRRPLSGTPVNDGPNVQYPTICLVTRTQSPPAPRAGGGSHRVKM